MTKSESRSMFVGGSLGTAFGSVILVPFYFWAVNSSASHDAKVMVGIIAVLSGVRALIGGLLFMLCAIGLAFEEKDKERNRSTQTKSAASSSSGGSVTSYSTGRFMPGDMPESSGSYTDTTDSRGDRDYSDQEPGGSGYGGCFHIKVRKPPPSKS